MVKNLPGNAADPVWEVEGVVQENLLKKEMATNSSILGWKIPWTE